MKKKIENISLYNIVSNKTRIVRRYILNLEPEPRDKQASFDVYKNQLDIFNERRKQALMCSSMNEALDIIGYRYKKKPLIMEVFR